MILVSERRDASESGCEAAPQAGARTHLLRSLSKRISRRQSVHSESAIRPQLFHTGRSAELVRVAIASLILVGACWSAVSAVAHAQAQAPRPGPTYRVFLRNGQALPSYGEAATVGDRLVFNLSIGSADGSPVLQLISLPLPQVDLERTIRYAEAMRAALYAATRGETDYAALTEAIRGDLQKLPGLERPLQLGVAEQIRQRLVSWPANHFHYRTRDVENLQQLLHDVIRELRKADGEAAFSLELIAGPPEPVREALLPAPGLQESIELAMAAATAADLGEDRLAVLRAASAVSGDTPALRETVSRRLELEVRAGTLYNALAASIRTRAQAAETRGDVGAIDRLEAELFQRDRQLGFRRPADVQRIVEEMAVSRVAARRTQEMFDRYAAVRGRLLDYERQVRPALSALDGLRSVLEYFRDMRHVSFERVLATHDRLVALLQQVNGITPPEDFAGLHATLTSALSMAREASDRRRQAAATNAMRTFSEASAAAAGALLLAERTRADLVFALCLGGRISTCGKLQ